jgi:hypothetical protein
MRISLLGSSSIRHREGVYAMATKKPVHSTAASVARRFVAPNQHHQRIRSRWPALHAQAFARFDPQARTSPLRAMQFAQLHPRFLIPIRKELVLQCSEI